MKNEILYKILKKLKITTYKKQKHEQKAKITTKRRKYMLRQAFFPHKQQQHSAKIYTELSVHCTVYLVYSTFSEENMSLILFVLYTLIMYTQICCIHCRSNTHSFITIRESYIHFSNCFASECLSACFFV